MSAQSDREHLRARLEELNNDLRVALPGVQVLFAFLLTMPFSARFSVLATGYERISYVVAFMAAAGSSIFLIAPSALHRLYHQLDDPGGLRSLYTFSTRVTVIGLLLLAISMAACIFMVFDLLFHRVAAVVAALVVAALMGWYWFGYAIMRRITERQVDTG